LLYRSCSFSFMITQCLRHSQEIWVGIQRWAGVRDRFGGVVVTVPYYVLTYAGMLTQTMQNSLLLLLPSDIDSKHLN